MNAGQQQQEIEQLRQQTDQQQQEIDRLTAELQAATDRLALIAAAAQGSAEIQPVPPQPPAAIVPPPTNQLPAQQSAAQPKAPGKLDVDDRIALAIVALMQHNQACTNHADRWFLSTNAISYAAGANPSERTTPWLQQHPAAVQAMNQHHASLGLHSRHNGKDKDKKHLKAILEQFVADKSSQELQHITNQFDPQPA